MTIVTVFTPAPVRVPRFAPMAAALFACLLQWLAAAGHALAASRRVAERQREARELRMFAKQQLGHDPRFAADLMAAADRHERIG